MKKELYVLRLEMYNEWAWENSACDLIGVYEDLEILKKDLKNCLEIDVNSGYILNNHASMKTILNKVDDNIKNLCIDVYTDESNYENGYNNGTYVIEKTTIKNV